MTMTALPCDCAPWPGRVDSDHRCFTCSGDLAHVRDKIRRHRLAQGDKPAAADREADVLAAKLFDQEVKR